MSSGEKEEEQNQSQFRQLTRKEVQRKDEMRKSDDSGADDNKNDEPSADKQTMRKRTLEYGCVRDEKHCSSSRSKNSKVDDRKNESEGRRKYSDDRRKQSSRHRDTFERGDDRNSQSGSNSSRNRGVSHRDSDRTGNRSPRRDRRYDPYGTHDHRSKSGRGSEQNYHRDRRHSSSRNNSESSPKDKDKPAWATKAVMKRAEEINQRKLIWSKPEAKLDEEQKFSSASETRPSTSATWNSILAASSTDGLQLDKFKRLMGMKKSDEKDCALDSGVSTEQIEAEKKRQHELYSGLDHQYAVARSITHLGRGQGLGFHH